MSRSVQIPSDSSQFAYIRQMISQSPFEFVPHRVDPADPSTSIGAMIVMDMFPWPWYYTALTNGVTAFIRGNPALFVPGSNAVDMTGIGMPPLADQHARHLQASRSRAILPLFDVRPYTIPRSAGEFNAVVRIVETMPYHYVYVPERRLDPQLSMGQAILRQRFPGGSVSVVSPYYAQVRQFITDHPRLFVPGSYHTDMTGIGMPRLTFEQVGDLAAERGAVMVNDVASSVMPVVSEALVGIAIQPREPPSSRQFRSFGENCPVCFETLDADGTTLLQCGHLYHASCLLGLTPRRCPECRSPNIPTLSVLSATVQRLWDRLRVVSGELKATEDKLEETTGRLEETNTK
jgi:hypothetical protein